MKILITEKQKKILEFDIKNSNMDKLKQLLEQTSNILSDSTKRMSNDLIEEVDRFSVRVTGYSPKEIKQQHKKY